MHQSGDGRFTYMGRRREPQKHISCEQFAQCQLQMLVMDVETCDLISYSLGKSRIFCIRRENRWLSMALEVLAHVNITYMQPGVQPKPDALMDDKAALYRNFMAATKSAMHRLAQQTTLLVDSAVNQAAMEPRFLDAAAPEDERRQRVGKHKHCRSIVMCHDQPNRPLKTSVHLQSRSSPLQGML